MKEYKILKTFSNFENIDERIEKCKNMLYETYHENTSFDKVIIYSVKKIMEYKKDKHDFLFYTGYVWNSKLKICEKTEESKLYDDNIFPIYISVKYINDISIDAYTLTKDDEPDNILITINRFFLDRNECSSNEIYSCLKHEFIHVYHGYAFDGIDILKLKKNTVPFYDIEDIPPDIRKYFGNFSVFNVFSKLLYYDSDTEKQARINGTVGYIKSLDMKQLEYIFKKYKHEENDFHYKVNAMFIETEMFSRFHEFENEITKLKNIYNVSYLNFPNYQPIIALAYILHLYSLLKTNPVIDDNFIKRKYEHYNLYNMRNFVDSDFRLDKNEISVMTQVVDYFENEIIKFKKRIFEVIYNTLNELYKK